MRNHHIAGVGLVDMEHILTEVDSMKVVAVRIRPVLEDRHLEKARLDRRAVGPEELVVLGAGVREQEA